MKNTLSKNRFFVPRALYPAALLLVGAFPGGQNVSAQAPVSAPARYNYGEALQKAVYFYDCQQAGKLPATNRVEWRGDSTLRDGADAGVDLSGGWYDAGDHIKYNLPMTFAATTLSWSVVEYREAWRKSGQLPHLLANLRHVNDYFLKCFTNDKPGQYELYGQVGNASSDHSAWASAEVIDLVTERKSYKITTEKPGSDLAAATAASLASASLIFRPTDAPYADRLLGQAEKLHDFADKYRGHYSKAFDAEGYRYGNFPDKLVWASLWLHLAKTAQKPAYGGAYLAKAEADFASFNLGGGHAESQSWAGVRPGVYVLLAKLTGKPQYRDEAAKWGDFWSTGLSNGERSAYTPGGMAFGKDDNPSDPKLWGSLRSSCNQAFLALVLGDTVPDPVQKKRYHLFAKQQIDYALGSNPSNRSYVVGFTPPGKTPTNTPHHRTAYGAWAGWEHLIPSKPEWGAGPRHLLYGGLLGGPNKKDEFTPNIGDAEQNEVAVDYNAGFTAALPALFAQYGGKPLANFPPKAARADEFFVEAAVAASEPKATVVKALLNNRSAWPARVPAKLSFRYYVTLEPGVTHDQVRVSLASGSDSGATVAPDLKKHKGTIYYATVHFDGAKIFPGGLDGKNGYRPFYRKEVTLRLESAGAWNPENDPSFTALPGPGQPALKTEHIPVYSDQKKVFGKAPV